MSQYSPCVVLVWSVAEVEAQAAGYEQIEPGHLMLSLCKVCELPLANMMDKAPAAAKDRVPEMQREIDSLRAALGSVGLDTTRFRRRLRGELGHGTAERIESPLHRSDATRRVFRRAEKLGLAGPGGAVGLFHLFQALVEVEAPPWNLVLGEQGVSRTALARAVGVTVAESEGDTRSPGEVPSPGGSPQRVSTPMLDKFGRDLTRLADDGKLEPVVGRRAEMTTLAQALMQKRKSNAILVGEAGVGKTCVVEGLAQRIVGPKAPPALRDKRIVEVTMASLVAGTSLRGQFEERMQQLVREASSDEDLILFIDEIHTMMNAGQSEGSGGAADILKPALARGDIRCIGATTVREYRQFVEKDPALERRFHTIWVDEPTRDEALEIVAGLKSRFEEHHGLVITDEAVAAAVEMSMRYLPDFRLPDKAIDLIDQACARSRMATLSFRADLVGEAGQAIGRREIGAVIAQRCRIPVDRLTEDEAERLLQMEEALGRRVMGQDEAIRQVSEAVRTARAGLKEPNRPVGVFLFLGTTGTGKTELAKALAEFLFDDENRLIRFDMSEYMEKHTVSKLIGSPPGYIGHEEEGQLTGQVRSHPYSLVLFDEVEKAHPEVFDLFLQIFDDGRLTDSRGRRASFTESVIILTSNLGSAQGAGQRKPIGLALGAGGEPSDDRPDREAYRQEIMGAVRERLRPELLNRVSRCVFFYPLSAEAVRRIIDKTIDRLRRRLADRRIDVRLDDDAHALLMAQGYDEAFGAREMERAIDRLIVQPLGKQILEGRFSAGQTVRVGASAGAMTFEVSG